MGFWKTLRDYRNDDGKRPALKRDIEELRRALDEQGAVIEDIMRLLGMEKERASWHRRRMELNISSTNRCPDRK